MINFFLLWLTLLRFLVHQRARDCIIWIFPDSVTSTDSEIAFDRPHFTLDISALTEAVITLIVAASILLGSPGPATMSPAVIGASAGFGNGLSYRAAIPFLLIQDTHGPCACCLPYRFLLLQPGRCYPEFDGF